MNNDLNYEEFLLKIRSIEPQVNDPEALTQKIMEQIREKSAKGTLGRVILLKIVAGMVAVLLTGWFVAGSFLQNHRMKQPENIVYTNTPSIRIDFPEKVPFIQAEIGSIKKNIEILGVFMAVKRKKQEERAEKHRIYYLCYQEFKHKLKTKN